MESNQMIGHYQVIQEIDRGGMATVYLAYDQKMAREVALKVLPQQFTHDQSLLRVFKMKPASWPNLNTSPLYQFTITGKTKAFLSW